MSSDSQIINKIRVDNTFFSFIEEEVCDGLDISAKDFFKSLSQILNELQEKNTSLLEKRDLLQSKIDQWHAENKRIDLQSYKKFLEGIEYITPMPDKFSIDVEEVDDEISQIAGPQLVVPITNQRFVLNAVNARWGSLYDALYGTDAIPELDGAERTRVYTEVRGAAVIKFARDFLDSSAPLVNGTHHNAVSYSIKNNQLLVQLNDGVISHLSEPEKLIGYEGELESPKSILLKNNNLHFEISINRNHVIGKDDPAGVRDVIVEAAITTIMDCEDSVATVDAEDKVIA